MMNSGSRFVPRTLAALTVFSLVFMSGLASAETEFFGVKMPSESFAKGVTIRDGSRAADAFPSDAGVDKNVFATARLGNGLEITVTNHGAAAISTDYLFTDYTLVTTGGQRYTLSQPDPVFYPATKSIAPNTKATFRPSLAGLPIRDDDIRYLICSFDMGETKVVLVPLPKSERLSTPAHPAREIKFEKAAALESVQAQPKKPAAAPPSSWTWPWQSKPAAQPAKPAVRVNEPAALPKRAESFRAPDEEFPLQPPKPAAPRMNVHAAEKPKPDVWRPVPSKPEEKQGGWTWPWQKKPQQKAPEQRVEPRVEARAEKPSVQFEPVGGPRREEKWSWALSKDKSTAVLGVSQAPYNTKLPASSRWKPYWETSSKTPVQTPAAPARKVQPQPAPKKETAGSAPEKNTSGGGWLWPWQKKAEPKKETRKAPAQAPQPKPAAKPVSGPFKITQPQAVFDAPGSVTLTWSTSRVSRCWVQYGIAPGHLPLTGKGPAQGGTEHSISLSGLKPGVTYYFQAFAAEGKNEIKSPVIKVRGSG